MLSKLISQTCAYKRSNVWNSSVGFFMSTQGWHMSCWVPVLVLRAEQSAAEKQASSDSIALNDVALNSTIRYRRELVVVR